MWKSAASQSYRSLVRQRCFVLDTVVYGELSSALPSRHVSSLTPQHSQPESGSLETANTSSNHLPNVLTEKLIDFHISAKIIGDESHVVMIELQPGETLRAESGAMIFMTEGIVMDTKLNGASSAFSRMLTGQNLFLTDFRYENTTGTGTVCLGTDFPSKILRLTLSDHPEHALICQKGAYLASNPSVDIAVQFTQTLTAGFFGGQGFGGGTLVTRHLPDGATLRVTSGSLVALETTVSYDVQMMPGITNAMFGGEGLFVTTLTGPGRVWLQGLPPDRLIAEIARRVPSGGGIGLGIPLYMGGGGGGGVEPTVGGVESTGGAAEVEAAVEADRAATVASSGALSSEAASMDADSPAALFGDAVNDTAPVSNDDAAETSFMGDDASSSTSSEPQYESFSKSEFNSNEPSFDDEFSAEGTQVNDGELFDDTGAAPSEDVVEDAKGMFRQLWDYFSDQD